MCPEFESVKDFCARTGFSRMTVERRIREGVIVVYRAKDNGKRLIEIAAANRMMRRKGRASAKW